MIITLDEVGEYLQQFKKYGNYGMACCEFHPDENPSMSVSNNGYFCKSCGASGSLLKLYNKVSNQPIQIKEKVYNPSAWVWRNWEEKFGDLKSVCKLAHQNLVQNKGFDSYLISRGFDTKSIEMGTIGYLDGYFLFPIRDEFGEIQGATARASPSTQTKNNRYTTSYNCPIKLYVPSWSRVLEAKEIYLCYGIFDAWSLYLAGYASLTGIGGQDLNARNLERFRKPIYIIPDRKEERAGIHLQTQLDWRGKLLILPWYELNCKDPNELYNTHGVETLNQLIEKAKEKYNYGE